MNIKIDIINLLNSIDKGAYSNIELNNLFNKKKFSTKEKKFITEIFYGVIRNKIYIDFILENFAKNIKKDFVKQLLRISIYQINFMKSDNSGVVFEAVEISKKKYSKPLASFINAVLRNYIRNVDSINKNLIKENKIDILYSMTNDFISILKSIYDENYIEAIKSYKKTPYTCFRVNTLKYNVVSFENLIKELNINIIKKVDTLYYVDSGELINSQEFKDGKIIIQDVSSYLAAKNLNAKENELILDTCAAPASKSLVIAEQMKNKGEIISLDIHKHKIKLIEENAKKSGINIIKAINMDARLCNKQGRQFDKILVDAPCSGLGVVRKKPEIILHFNKNNIDELAKLQLEILESASDILKLNGTLVYSTCTITKEENTHNIKKFLNKHSNFKVEKLYIPENIIGEYDELGGFLINYKEELADSFYIIKLKKVEEAI